MKTKLKFIWLASPLLCLVFLGQSCQSGSDGGFFTSSDKAENWEPKNLIGYSQSYFFRQSQPINNNNEDIFTITVDPQNTDIIYYGTVANGMYKTKDKAELWEKVPNVGGAILSIAVNPKDSNIIFAANDSNVIRSQDGGETWETVHTDPHGAYVRDVIVDWYNPKQIYASSDSGTVIKSTDSGSNWEIVYQIESAINQLQMDAFDSRILYFNNKRGKFFKTTNGGEEWVNVNEGDFYKNGSWPLEKGEILNFRTDPSTKNRIFAASNDTMVKSLDGGQTWEIVESLLPFESDQYSEVRNITISPKDKETIYFTVGHIIHKSKNGGKDWHTIEDFPSSRQIFSMVADPKNPDLLYAGTRQVEKQSGFIPTN